MKTEEYKFFKDSNKPELTEYSLPIAYSFDNEYWPKVKNAFWDYFILVSHIVNRGNSKYKNLLIDLDDVAWTLEQAYFESISGSIEKARRRIFNLLRKYNDRFIFPLGKSYAAKVLLFYSKPDEDAGTLYFYRARFCPDKINKDVDPKEMFHIPFNLRSKVSSERFSLPGIPCLYLADSSYIAQEEISKSTNSHLHFSCFRGTEVLNKSLIIDLSPSDNLSGIYHKRKHTKNGFEKATDDEIEKMEMESPAFLINIACSCHCFEQNRAFKSEYVIPHLLMLNLKYLNCIGISYNSTFFNPSCHVKHVCYAFPAIPRKNQIRGYSRKLSSLFTLTAGKDLTQFIDKTTPEKYKSTNYEPLSNFNIFYPHPKSEYFKSQNMNYEQWTPTYNGCTPVYELPNYFFDNYLIETGEFKKIKSDD